MNTKLTICVSIFFMAVLAGILHADVVIREFAFVTVDGRVIDSATLKGMPMVISIGTHW